MMRNKTWKRLRSAFYIVLIPVLIFIIFVQLVNINSKDMTGRQKVMKAIYPLLMTWNKLTGSNRMVLKPQTPVLPKTSFYDLSAELNNDSVVHMESFKGKKILLVNTASNCGYTNQYAGLEDLYNRYQDKLQIIAFPANDFKEQEKSGDAEIQQFCSVNFGVGFPVAKKTIVIKQQGQHPVYEWLTDKMQNGWNDQAPNWNFSKYLIDEHGKLTHYFDPGIDPLSKEMIAAITQ
jgi:glutathione peroxidase